MDDYSLDFTILGPIIWFMIGVSITVVIYEGKKRWRKKRHKHRKFSLNVIFKNNNTMSLNATTLTNTTPVSGAIVMMDEFGNEYTGTLAVTSLSVADPAIDDASVNPSTDPTVSSSLIVTSKGTDGPDSVVLVGDFTSQGNATSRPNPDGTKPASKVIPDGQVFTGLTCTVSITNDITRQFVLAVKLP